MSLPKPYYDQEGITIYHADCRDILPHLEPVDLVLTDPPYGINYIANNPSVRKGLGVKPVEIVNDKELIDLRFILSMNCDVVSFGANNYPEQLPHRGRWICWDKRVIENADKMLGSPFELAWRNINHGYDTMIRLMHGGVVSADRDGKRFHPTQKPVQLMVRIMQLYPKSDTILDPFMGSGTTLVAAQSLGRRAVGIEIEQKYCDIAIRRLKQQPLPLCLTNTISHDTVDKTKQGELFNGS
jgi:DNA modification methylase